ALSWTLFHPINEQSPLFGTDKETLAASEINFILSIVGFDETSGQTVHSRDVFTAQDVRWNHEYVDFVWIDDEGMRHIDYAKIDATRLAAPSAGRAEDKRSPARAGETTEFAGIQPETSSIDANVPQGRQGTYD